MRIHQKTIITVKKTNDCRKLNNGNPTKDMTKAHWWNILTLVKNLFV